jgi:hypothetical protein
MTLSITKDSIITLRMAVHNIMRFSRTTLSIIVLSIMRLIITTLRQNST